LLSGAGGDDLFTGYRRHRSLSLEKWWSWLPLGVRRNLKSASRWAPSNTPSGRRVQKVFRNSDVFENERIARYFSWIDADLLQTAFANRADADCAPHALDCMRETVSECSQDVDPINRMLLLDLKYFLTDHNLNYADKMTMANGVETRVPLVDIELVELAFKIPVRFKQKGKHGKWIFKKAMEGILPNDVIYRPKAGFGVPLRQWLHHDLKNMMDDLLSEERVNKRGIFDYQNVTRMIQLDKQGQTDLAYPLFSMLCMELWFSRFLD